MRSSALPSPSLVPLSRAPSSLRVDDEGLFSDAFLNGVGGSGSVDDSATEESLLDAADGGSSGSNVVLPRKRGETEMSVLKYKLNSLANKTSSRDHLLSNTRAEQDSLCHVPPAVSRSFTRLYIQRATGKLHSLLTKPKIKPEDGGLGDGKPAATAIIKHDAQGSPSAIAPVDQSEVDDYRQEALARITVHERCRSILNHPRIGYREKLSHAQVQRGLDFRAAHGGTSKMELVFGGAASSKMKKRRSTGTRGSSSGSNGGAAAGVEAARSSSMRQAIKRFGRDVMDSDNEEEDEADVSARGSADEHKEDGGGRLGTGSSSQGGLPPSSSSSSSYLAPSSSDYFLASLDADIAAANRPVPLNETTSRIKELLDHSIPRYQPISLPKERDTSSASASGGGAGASRPTTSSSVAMSTMRRHARFIAAQQGLEANRTSMSALSKAALSRHQSMERGALASSRGGTAAGGLGLNLNSVAEVGGSSSTASPSHSGGRVMRDESKESSSSNVDTTDISAAAASGRLRSISTVSAPSLRGHQRSSSRVNFETANSNNVTSSSSPPHSPLPGSSSSLTGGGALASTRSQLQVTTSTPQKRLSSKDRSGVDRWKNVHGLHPTDMSTAAAATLKILPRLPVHAGLAAEDVSFSLERGGASPPLFVDTHSALAISCSYLYFHHFKARHKQMHYLFLAPDTNYLLLVLFWIVFLTYFQSASDENPRTLEDRAELVRNFGRKMAELIRYVKMHLALRPDQRLNSWYDQFAGTQVQVQTAKGPNDGVQGNQIHTKDATSDVDGEITSTSARIPSTTANSARHPPQHAPGPLFDPFRCVPSYPESLFSFDMERAVVHPKTRSGIHHAQDRFLLVLPFVLSQACVELLRSFFPETEHLLTDNFRHRLDGDVQKLINGVEMSDITLINQRKKFMRDPLPNTAQQQQSQQQKEKKDYEKDHGDESSSSDNDHSSDEDGGHDGASHRQHRRKSARRSTKDDSLMASDEKASFESLFAFNASINPDAVRAGMKFHESLLNPHHTSVPGSATLANSAKKLAVEARKVAREGRERAYHEAREREHQRQMREEAEARAKAEAEAELNNTKQILRKSYNKINRAANHSPSRQKQQEGEEEESPKPNLQSSSTSSAPTITNTPLTRHIRLGGVLPPDAVPSSSDREQSSKDSSTAMLSPAPMSPLAFPGLPRSPGLSPVMFGSPVVGPTSPAPSAFMTPFGLTSSASPATAPTNNNTTNHTAATRPSSSSSRAGVQKQNAPVIHPVITSERSLHIGINTGSPLDSKASMEQAVAERLAQFQQALPFAPVGGASTGLSHSSSTPVLSSSSQGGGGVAPSLDERMRRRLREKPQKGSLHSTGDWSRDERERREFLRRMNARHKEQEKMNAEEKRRAEMRAMRLEEELKSEQSRHDMASSCDRDLLASSSSSSMPHLGVQSSAILEEPSSGDGVSPLLEPVAYAAMKKRRGAVHAGVVREEEEEEEEQHMNDTKAATQLSHARSTSSSYGSMGRSASTPALKLASGSEAAMSSSTGAERTPVKARPSAITIPPNSTAATSSSAVSLLTPQRSTSNTSAVSIKSPSTAGGELTSPTRVTTPLPPPSALRRSISLASVSLTRAPSSASIMSRTNDDHHHHHHLTPSFIPQPDEPDTPINNASGFTASSLSLPLQGVLLAEENMRHEQMLRPPRVRLNINALTPATSVALNMHQATPQWGSGQLLRHHNPIPKHMLGEDLGDGYAFKPQQSALTINVDEQTKHMDEVTKQSHESHHRLLIQYQNLHNLQLSESRLRMAGANLEHGAMDRVLRGIGSAPTASQLEARKERIQKARLAAAQSNAKKSTRSSRMGSRASSPTKMLRPLTAETAAAAASSRQQQQNSTPPKNATTPTMLQPLAATPSKSLATATTTGAPSGTPQTPMSIDPSSTSAPPTSTTRSIPRSHLRKPLSKLDTLLASSKAVQWSPMIHDPSVFLTPRTKQILADVEANKERQERERKERERERKEMDNTHHDKQEQQKKKADTHGKPIVMDD